MLQIDSVNVLARAHYLPLFARLGGYDTTLLDEAVWPSHPRRRRDLVEVWGHEASMVPVEVYPLLWWRRRDHADGRWGSAQRLAAEHPGFVDDVERLIAGAGPLSAGEVERLLQTGRGAGGWWGWSTTKTACEVLFASGRIATAHRRAFERFYDLTERVLPARILATPRSTEPDAKRALIEIAARRLGVATLADLADYYRMRTADAAAAVRDLVEDGTVEPVQVQGWDYPAFLHRAAPAPRPVGGAALLCPFDPLIWFRERTERLFGFRYRIEIYTPAARRQHGYYVFPLLQRDALVARLDLKADRQRGTLLVQAAWLEPGQSPDEVAHTARAELTRMANWLGLGTVEVQPRGDLPLAWAG